MNWAGRILSLAGAINIFVLAACGGSSSGTTPTSPPSPDATATTFQGTVGSGSGQSGTIYITISAAASAQSTGVAAVTTKAASAVTGTVTLSGGSPVSLTGTFDSATNAVNLSGGGFSFTGRISNGALSGTYTAPSSGGAFSSLDATRGSVTVYCGTYRSSEDSGVFNIVIAANGTASGVTVPDGAQQACILSGQLAGTTINLSCSDGTSGTGTLQNGTISGTTTGAAGGTFTASVCR